MSINSDKLGAFAPLQPLTSTDQTKANVITVKVNRSRENITPPIAQKSRSKPRGLKLTIASKDNNAEASTVKPKKSKRKQRKFNLALIIEDSNAAAPAVKRAEAPAEAQDADSIVLAPHSEQAKMMQASIPQPPQLVSMTALTTIKGIKSGQGALLAKWIDPVTQQTRTSKCKIFDLNTCSGYLPVLDPKLRGMVTAPLTGYLCPETVIPTSVVKDPEGRLISMQNMQHGSEDLHRYYKNWLKKPENEDSTVIDFLNALFTEKPKLEEEFIVASLSEIVIGSVDSKAPNTLFNPSQGTFKLCDTDISLRDVSIAAEAMLTAQTGKSITYLCERTGKEGQRLAFMGQSLTELADRHPKVKAFLDVPDRAERGRSTYLAVPANKALVSVSPGLQAIVDEGVQLVSKRMKLLQSCKSSGSSITDLLSF